MSEYIRKNTDLLCPHRVILDCIPYGENYAISQNSIANELRIDERTVRQLVERARRNGHIIASTKNGYYIPTCEDELKRYISKTLSQIYSSVYALDPALRFIGKTIKVNVLECDNAEK